MTNNKLILGCATVVVVLVFTVSLAATRSKRRRSSGGIHQVVHHSAASIRDFDFDVLADALTNREIATVLKAMKNDLPDFEKLSWSNSEHFDFSASIDIAIERYLLREEFPLRCGEKNLQNFAEDLITGLDNASFAAFLTLYLVFPVSRWLMDATVFFNEDDTDEFFGTYGAKTRELKQRFTDNKLFWDTKSSDILLLGIHGSLLADKDKMLRLLREAYGVDEVIAVDIIDMVQELIQSPELGYDFPLWTFGAMAVSFHDEPLPKHGLVSDKICIGDGLIRYLEWAGLDDNGLDMVLSHEIAHHAQYETFFGKDYPHTHQTGAFKELMADAMGAYYSSHPRGAAFPPERVMQAYEVTFDDGECDFTSANHHGRSDQKLAAASWGSERANEADNKGEIMAAAEFIMKFSTEAFPFLVDPFNEETEN